MAELRRIRIRIVNLFPAAGRPNALRATDHAPTLGPVQYFPPYVGGLALSTPAPRSLPYAILDVFAEQPLAGNPLAVFHDARGLSTADMQALARETNLSETTFILPRDPAIERERGVQVRIFTTQEELPFAGHPTLGTAAWLFLNHPTLRGASRITLDLPVGAIPVDIPAAPAALGIYASMRQNDPTFGQTHSPEAVARALGLTLEDLDPTLPIQTVSTGLAFCIVPLRSLEVAQRLRVPPQASQDYLSRTDAKFFHCITRADPATGADWHARMQFYNGEDPATGSASGCTAAWLVRHNLAPSGHPIVLEQGVEMLRPSRIYVQATAVPHHPCVLIRDVRVSGRTIPMATGEFFLPPKPTFAQEKNRNPQQPQAV